MKALRVYLRKARTRQGLLQKEVAKRLGYSSPQFISNWERGVSEPPLEKLKDLIKLYSLSEKELKSIFLKNYEKKLKKHL